MALLSSDKTSRAVAFIGGALAGTRYPAAFGYAFGLMAGICYGAWTVVAKSTLDNYTIPPILFAAIAFFFGTIMFSPVLVYSVPRAFVSSRRSIVMFILAGLSSAFAIIALSFGLEKGEVTVVSPIVAVSPLITLVLVRIFLERLERISLPLVLGALLVVGGTALVVVGNTVL